LFKLRMRLRVRTFLVHSMLRIQKFLNWATTRRTKRFVIYKDLKRAQFSSRDEYEERLTRRLRELVNHAVRTVPYYAEFAKGLGSDERDRLERASPDDMRILPILTKESIRALGDRLHSSDHVRRGSYWNSSGGTTGQPTQVLQDPDFYEHANAQTLLVRSWRGAGPFDAVIRIWGAQRDFGSTRWNLKLRDFVRNRIILNCFKMTEQEMEGYLRVLQRHHPKVIISYVAAAYELANFAEQKGIRVKLDAPIQTGAGTLFEPMRERIESVFGTKVFNHYGARETGAIASECEHASGLHILGDHVYVEIVDDLGRPCPPGGIGHVLVTSLNNFSMPILRYRIGDQAAWATKTRCECGRPYPLLERVAGRQSSVIRAANGALVDSNFFVHTIGVTEHHPNIRRFQLVQEDINAYTVRLMVTAEVPSLVTERIASRLRSVLGESVQIRFEYTDDLHESITGKFDFVVSKLPSKGMAA